MIIEALASGRRVVATRVGGIPDVIRRPEQGELVEARDVPALAAALARALSTPGDAGALAAGLPELVRQRARCCATRSTAGARKWPEERRRCPEDVSRLVGTGAVSLWRARAEVLAATDGGRRVPDAPDLDDALDARGASVGGPLWHREPDAGRD